VGAGKAHNGVQGFSGRYGPNKQPGPGAWSHRPGLATARALEAQKGSSLRRSTAP